MARLQILRGEQFFLDVALIDRFSNLPIRDFDALHQIRAVLYSKTAPKPKFFFAKVIPEGVTDVYSIYPPVEFGSSFRIFFPAEITSRLSTGVWFFEVERSVIATNEIVFKNTIELLEIKPSYFPDI